MKRYITVLALSALVCSSCSDFLDVQPEGNATTTSYFLNDQQAIDAIDGLYERFHQEGCYGRELFWEQGAACDIVWGRTRGYNSLATLAYTGDESPLRDVFSRMYSTMSRANWIIQELVKKEKGTTLTAVEKRSLGEAYFSRGWAHYLIAYRYGTDKQGVPFVRYEDFPDDYDNSIPPQDATQWNNVIEMVNQLENNYNRDLAPTFAELFSSDLKDYWNAEYLWTIPSIGGALPGGTEFPGIILENKGWGKYNGWGQMKPSYDIYEEMAKDGKGNDRLVRSILEYNQEFPFFGETRKFWSTSDLEAGFMINKYMDAFKYSDPVGEGAVSANGDWPTVRVNFPIIRFAEMLLFRAEAYLMTGQADKATADINRIRLRSNLTPLAGTATMKDLYHERRCELAFEFTDHLFDLKRWNRSSNTDIKTLADKELNAHPRIRRYEDRANPESAFTIIGYEDYTNKNAYQAHMMVFPYPSEEITKSNGQLKQNEGY